MNKSIRSDIESFKYQLRNYRHVVEGKRDSLDRKPFLQRKIVFWIESSRFCITELEILDELGDKKKYQHAFNRAQESLAHVHELITELLDE